MSLSDAPCAFSCTDVSCPLPKVDTHTRISRFSPEITQNVTQNFQIFQASTRTGEHLAQPVGSNTILCKERTSSGQPQVVSLQRSTSSTVDAWPELSPEFYKSEPPTSGLVLVQSWPVLATNPEVHQPTSGDTVVFNCSRRSTNSRISTDFSQNFRVSGCGPFRVRAEGR